MPCTIVSLLTAHFTATACSACFACVASCETLVQLPVRYTSPEQNLANDQGETSGGDSTPARISKNDLIRHSIPSWSLKYPA